jgi:O-antigen ligase
MNQQPDILVPAAPPGPSALCWLALVVVGFAFFCTEHNLFISSLEMYGTTQDELETNAAGGKLANQVGFSLIALLGGVLLLMPGGRAWRLGGVLPVLMILLGVWCLASSLWSINMMQSAKRWLIMVFCLAGTLGVARQLTTRDLTWLCLVITAAYAAIGIGAEVALGTFNPLDPHYRFAGTLHPNGQGANCALLALAIICLLRDTRKGRSALIALLMGAIVLMLLCRSRTAVAALLAGLLAISCTRPSRQLVAGVCALVWLIGAAAMVALVSGFDVVEDLPDILLLGRAEHVGTLTGRTELWEELLPYVEERPLLGYGYGCFWNADHIDAVSKALYWDLSSAHSAYLEMVLGVGLVGGVMVVLLFATALWKAGRRYWETSGSGDAFVFALTVYGVVDGISESDFTAPAFMTFVAGCGLCRLAFFAEGRRMKCLPTS